MEIKEPKYKKHSHQVGLSESSLGSLLDRIDYPIFCFKYIDENYGIEKCLRSDVAFSKQLLKKINLVSQLSWTEIQMADKKGHRTEKIDKNSIKRPIPSVFTEDVQFVLSFYFNGKKGRMIGHRNKSIFHVLFIDTCLDLYDHS